ncbi:MAG TPA: sigma-54 dependent transcriptional regulator [Blastocatellia bacterium]|nr:sigma-54 dependent transcriptional regulator [Blastocatellia bacterium]
MTQQHTRNRILVVDDEKNQRELYQMVLDDAGYAVQTAPSGQAALRIYEESEIDLVLTDYNMAGMDGLALLKELVARDPSSMVVMITAFGSVDSVKEALRSGAYDYLEKPVDRETLLKVVTEALAGLRQLDADIIGSSDAIERVKKMVLKVASSSSTVLIRGESGTGKEKVARAIHSASPRSAGLFQAINCAAIPENLLESELFGHEKGSFTGASGQRKGLFETASGGSLFLDEIGDITPAMQVKLLRALQEREVTRVGGNRPIPVDVRIIAATNRDLEALVKDGRFREDLYYRINVIPIQIPPLRERRDDIPPLVDHFIAKHAQAEGRKIRGLSGEARKLIMEYAWPGNVRQLESAIERAILLAETDRIEAEDLPFEIRQASEPATNFAFKLPPEGISFEELERSLIIQAMEQSGWNITRAAKLLGLSFRTLQYRLDKFGIKKRSDDQA